MSRESSWESRKRASFPASLIINSVWKSSSRWTMFSVSDSRRISTYMVCTYHCLYHYTDTYLAKPYVQVTVMLYYKKGEIWMLTLVMALLHGCLCWTWYSMLTTACTSVVLVGLRRGYPELVTPPIGRALCTEPIWEENESTTICMGYELRSTYCYMISARKHYN